jgi:hypothetical protein
MESMESDERRAGGQVHAAVGNLWAEDRKRFITAHESAAPAREDAPADRRAMELQWNAVRAR